MKIAAFKRSIIAVLVVILVAFMAAGIAGCSKVSNVTTPITENILAGINAKDYAVFSKDFDISQNPYSFQAVKGTDESRFEIVYQYQDILGVNSSIKNKKESVESRATY